MAITSSSTQADIVAAYLDNAGYDVDGSVSRCQLFIEACRALLVMHPADWQHGNGRVMFQPQLWQQQLNDARQWLASAQAAAATGAGGIEYFGFGDFR